MDCRGCGGSDVMKRGRKAGRQRYQCRECGRCSTDSEPKFSAGTKALAIELYMNNMGIRAIGRVLGASPASVLNWIRKEHGALQARLAQATPTDTGVADIIEMDEIYTYVQKKPGAR